MTDEELMNAIRSARRQIDTETAAHDKRIEFWRGYISAMEEVRSSLEKTP